MQRSFDMEGSRMKKIAIIGLGYVGLPLAVEFGKVYETVGYDIDVARIEDLRRGIDRTKECNSEQIANAKNLRFENSVEHIRDSQIYIVTVPTPIDTASQPDLKPLQLATETVASVISSGDIVIFESTVFPGATEEICVPILEEISGLVFNEDFYCGYSPERINPGDKVNTITKIKKITSGSNEATRKEVDQLYCSIVTAGTWAAPSIKVAEAAKVIENSQRDINIAFVNELSMIFQKLDIDTTEVLEAAGSKWNFIPFRPGMVGGHCIGVDPFYLTHKAQLVGHHPEIILAGRKINDGMAIHAAHSVLKRMAQNKLNLADTTIGILGVTFKENCPDIRNSKVFDLISELKNWGVRLKVCDPWASKTEVLEVSQIDLVGLHEIKGVDSLIVAVSHDAFKLLSPSDLRQLCYIPGAVIGDLKAIYDRQKLKDVGFDVFRL